MKRTVVEASIIQIWTSSPMMLYVPLLFYLFSFDSILFNTADDTATCGSQQTYEEAFSPLQKSLSYPEAKEMENQD